MITETIEQLVDRFVRSMGTPDFRPAEIALLAKFQEQAERIEALEAAMLEATDNCETCRGIEDVERLCARCQTFLEIVYSGKVATDERD